MDHRRDALADRFARFSDRLASAGGVAHRASTVDHAAQAIRSLAADPTTIWTSGFAADAHPGVLAALRDAGYRPRVPADPPSVRDQPFGLTAARLAIAETGSVLLVEPHLPDRAVSLVTETLVVLCDAAALVDSLDDAAPVLREIGTGGGSYATFVTGPSRTADIERQLSIGVQGPSALHVILLGENAHDR